MALHLTIPDTLGDADREAILVPLRAYNLAQAGDPRHRPVAILLTDEDGVARGGLWGRTAYDWLFVELLAVPEAERNQGHGRALLAQAEAIARAAGCIGLWLDTYEFQARGFYERLGFTLFGTLDDHPLGQKRYFLSKRLPPA